MKKILLTLSLAVIALGAQAQYQIENSDFEDWTASSGEPDHWHGFKSATGSFSGMAKGTLASSTDVRPGTSGSKSAVITSGSVLGIINNGSMTTGQLKAASMTTANTANHAEMDKNSTSTDKNGDKFYMPLTGHPDALKVWIKFSQASTNSSYPYASFNAVITDGSYYQDPEDKTYTNKVAQAKNATISVCNWTEFTVAFDYDSYASNNATPAAILCTFGTNAIPGKGSNGDKVYIDDLELLYYSELKSATYDGNKVTFTNGAATVNAEYDESLLSLTSNGKAASIETSYDATSYVLTITVKGENISEDTDNYHTYTIQFDAPSTPAVTIVGDPVNYSDYIVVTVNEESTQPQSASIVKNNMSDGTTQFIIKNFALDGIPVGNITLSNVTVNSDGTFTTSQTIQIEAGDDPAYTADSWIGPFLGDIPIEMTGVVVSDTKFKTTIAIDMSASLGQIIDVRYGFTYERSVATGNFATMCFAGRVDAKGAEATTGYIIGATVYSIEGRNGDYINLTEETGALVAGQPYIFVATADQQYFTTNATETTASSYNGLVGSLEGCSVSEGYYVMYQNEVCKAGSGVTIGTNRAYIDLDNVPTSNAVKDVRLSVEGMTDGISAIESESNNTVIYNLAGQRVNRANKGVYIINGKKMVIK